MENTVELEEQGGITIPLETWNHIGVNPGDTISFIEGDDPDVLFRIQKAQ